jgi:hypothetical protein
MSLPFRRVIATRRLAYRAKGEDAFKDFTVRVSEPYVLTEDSAGISYAQGAASGCLLRLLPHWGVQADGGAHEFHHPKMFQAHDVRLRGAR